jgi:hypothetical protein
MNLVAMRVLLFKKKAIRKPFKENLQKKIHTTKSIFVPTKNLSGTTLLAPAASSIQRWHVERLSSLLASKTVTTILAPL